MSTTKQWNSYDACAAVEGFDGEDHKEEELIGAWQYLIDIGLVWKLQGWYGRQAKRLIDQGICEPTRGVK